jgi:hypothetical protein
MLCVRRRSSPVSLRRSRKSVDHSLARQTRASLFSVEPEAALLKTVNDVPAFLPFNDFFLGSFEHFDHFPLFAICVRHGAGSSWDRKTKKAFQTPARERKAAEHKLQQHSISHPPFGERVAPDTRPGT